jgi:hypothetical protein
MEGKEDEKKRAERMPGGLLLVCRNGRIHMLTV